MAKRENGEGSISFDKSRNKYRAAIIDINGCRIYKRFNTRDEARNWINQTKIDMLTDQYVVPSNITLGEWILEWIHTFKKNLKITTQYEYLYRCTYLKPISNIELQKLTAITIQKFLNALDTFSKQKKSYILLNSAIKKAFLLRLIKYNFMTGVECPKSKTNKVIEIFTTEELQQIFSYLKCDNTPKKFKKFYPFILLVATTGIRIGEAFSLKWENVDFKEGTIKIVSNTKYVRNYGHIENTPKTFASKRMITLPLETLNVLNDYYVSTVKNIKFSKIIFLNPKHNYVFHTRNNTPYTKENFIHQYWKPIVINAGVKYKNFHTLRHTHATQLLAAGVPILEVTKRLGHSKGSTTLNLYGHAIPNMDKNVAQKISKIYAL